MGVKIPVIVWGNGGCLDSGTFFQNFLTEIASHGFLILANGAPAAGGQLPASNLLTGLAAGFGGIYQGGTLISSVSEQARSIDWATTGGAGKGKYGNADASKLAVAGQSCGGLEAYSSSYKEDRVKLTVLFDSGILSESKLPLLKDLKAPVSYFLGGPKDIAYAQGERDYTMLPAGMPSVKCNIDSGHMGRFSGELASCSHRVCRHSADGRRYLYVAQCRHFRQSSNSIFQVAVERRRRSEEMVP